MVVRFAACLYSVVASATRAEYFVMINLKGWHPLECGMAGLAIVCGVNMEQALAPIINIVMTGYTGRTCNRAMIKTACVEGISISIIVTVRAGKK